MKALQISTLAAVILVISFVQSTQPVAAQKWVRDMFEETSHDFGNVPRGAKTEYRFKLTNRYEEEVHIRSVKSSCGCTLPSIEKRTLKTYEEGSIICEFNTRSFIGQKSAGVTVEFDRPFYGQMQLMVRGNVRSDIVTEPGVIEFGEVASGTKKLTNVKISYAGTNQWKITDVRSVNKNFSVKLNRVVNPGGRVAYDMQVRMRDNAPVGSLNAEIILVTNDTNYNLVTIPVRGSIIPPLDVRVQTLGTVRTGTKTKGRVTIKAIADLPPFTVTKVECADDRFSFTLPKATQRAHVIPFSFDSGKKAGAFQEEVLVHTSLAENGVGKTTISGNIAE